MPNFNRHQIRQAAFQVLFALNANDTLELADAYQAVLTMDQFDAEEVVEVAVPDYLAFLVTGVTDHQAELDAALTPYLKKGWQLSRLAKPDLIILRLGLFEMQNSTEAPDKVALNEALELAKQFTDDQAKGFINGVLSKFVEA
ncbi:transcription antitermination factor NusB [Latilactobacillus curvatus]|uniref:transcription antitermination factor NusB n=1 Tax=Latilactobacillus curvatus TaxID=28038 RepID=UPI001CBB25DE|nr:transcription antitermination factor NusB [Latilactobacillus curvatus]MBZ1503952.1 transcription antitermination factor NusB [Latilactobacillus curvatus]